MSGGIRGSTKIYGVIGDPIDHTLSPLMFNAAFKQMDMDCVYVPFKVDKKSLGKAIDGMRSLNIAGLNVTIPHKINVMKLLDEVDGSARRMGAVNTIVNKAGKLEGFNTDGYGFLYALDRQRIEVKGRNVTVIGAGGASKAIVWVLAENGAAITILNRTLDKARELARLATHSPGPGIEALELNADNLARSIKKAEILVNTTSIGMSPDAGLSPLPAELLKGGMTVFDIVYNPLKTKLLSDAETAGCRIVEGIHMLAGQAALSFEKWTGKKAPVELMTMTAMENL